MATQIALQQRLGNASIWLSTAREAGRGYPGSGYPLGWESLGGTRLASLLGSAWLRSPASRPPGGHSRTVPLLGPDLPSRIHTGSTEARRSAGIVL